MTTIPPYGNEINKMPMAMKNMNWLFDTAKRDAHARLTGVLGGISAKKGILINQSQL